MPAETKNPAGKPPPTAIVSLIPGITNAQIAKQRDKLVRADESAMLRYADSRHSVQAQSPMVTDEWIMLMETRGWLGNSALHSLHGPWKEARRAAQALKSFESSTPKPTQPSARVAVLNGFAIKEALKARGYRFDRDGYWRDIVGLHTSPAWCKSLPQDILADELQALTRAGATVVKNDALLSLSEALRDT